MKEEWRQITGYEGRYDVSNLGRIKRIIGGQGTYANRVLKQSKNGVGYLQLKLSKENTNKHYYVHRLVATAFIGPCPEGKQVNHKDGDKTNNRPENLEYVTPHNNILHSIMVGLRIAACGEKNGSSKLIEGNVLKIRELLDSGCLSQAKIGDMFGVRQTTISSINTGRSWSWLK